MIKKLNSKRIIGALVVTASLITASFGMPAYAETPTEKVYPSLSPVNNKVDLEPGQTYTNSFNVGNKGAETFSFKIYADPYQEVGDNNTPNYSERGKYNDIVDWITFDKEGGSVAPGEKVEITYTVNVPDDAPGGGQYAALIIHADNEVKNYGGAEIGETSRIAYILYANIAGETNECAKILNNSINTFMFEPPIVANSLVENCGNTHDTASYVMKVYPLFSDQAIYTNEETPINRTLLPETRRYNTVSWTKEQGAPMMGIYNVEQTVKIGKESSTIKKLVFIFPLWLIIIFILLIAAIIFWLVSRSRARKESKRESVNTSARD